MLNPEWPVTIDMNTQDGEKLSLPLMEPEMPHLSSLTRVLFQTHFLSCRPVPIPLTELILL